MDILPSPAGLSGNDASSRALETVLASLENSKAENIVTIDIQGKSSLGDYMIVASGRSHRHVAAVAEQLLKALKDAGLGQARVEGLSGADWVLIDSGDIIVHVFRPEIREFYNHREDVAGSGPRGRDDPLRSRRSDLHSGFVNPGVSASA